MCTLHTCAHTLMAFVQFSMCVFDIFWSPPRCICCRCDGGTSLTLSAVLASFPSEVSSIVCAQVLHSLSSAFPRRPADRCYLRCYYPSSNKTTLFFLFQVVRHYFPAVVFFFFFYQQPTVTQICPNRLRGREGSAPR